MSIVQKKTTRLALPGWVALTILVALTQTAFAFQDRAKQSSITLKDNTPTQTAFTYQGQLKEGSVPANGAYTFRFALYTGQNGGRNLGVVIKDDVVVTKGSFTVRLDFGSDGFSSNESWLEVGARGANTAASYTELSPRQRLTPMPSAIAAQAEPRNVIGVPLAPQDAGAWIRDGKTVRLATSTDNVGIGTTKPVATLDVAGDIHASNSVTVGNSVGLLSSSSLNLIEVDDPHPLAIGFSSPMSTTPNAVAFSTIKVGIGTTGPTTTLDVNGGARIRTLTANSSLTDVVVADLTGVLFTRPANTLSGGPSWLLAGNTLTGSEILGSLNNHPLRIVTNNLERMRILDTNGNVGISTPTPTQRLTLGSGNVLLPNANSGTDGSLYFGGITNTGQVGMRLFGGLVNTTIPGGFIDVRVNPSNLADGLRFRVDASSGGAERMRITASGNVGIGTPAPAARFSVGNNTFQVDASGNLVRINGVPYSWPGAQGAPSTVLTNNGSGGLTWASVATGNCSSGANFVTKWSAISAVTCSQIFDNATNVGIGTINPSEKLEITGNFRLPASTASVGVIKSGANRFIHNFGVDNFFAGVNAGNFTMTTGCCSTAVGKDSFQSNISGVQNSALGRAALKSNTAGSDNTAIGNMSLQSNTTGHNNVAVGSTALASNVTGRDNIAIGAAAGSSLTTGDRNIDIGNSGVAAESGTMRIGSFGAQNRTFIAGIRNVTTGSPNALPVVIDSAGQLGTISSSQRFKEHIEKMGAASEVLYRLRPVSFLYKPEYGGRPDLLEFGLIAEDVAKVAPGLVVNDAQGQPFTVQYQFLAPMLLNEMQKKNSEIEELRARLDALEKLVEGLTKK